MNVAEWDAWHSDLADRLPELAEYIAGLSKATREKWFEEIFQKHELRDALAMNRDMFTGGDFPAKYERDKLPAFFGAELRKAAHERETLDFSRQVKRRRAKRLGREVKIGEAIRSHGVMGPMLDFVQEKMAEYKKETGEKPTREMIHRWTELASQKFDTIPDDEERQPRYACFRCQDTAVIGFEKDGIPDVGACPYCEAGKARAERKDHELGFVPHVD